MTGNVWEIVRSANGTVVMRGGCFYTNDLSAVIPNRGGFITATFRQVLMGTRICADAPAR